MSRILGGGRLTGRTLAAMLGVLGIANQKAVGGSRRRPSLLELIGPSRGRPSRLIATPNAMKFRYRTQNWKPGHQGARECARRVRQMQHGVLNYENGVARSVDLFAMRNVSFSLDVEAA